MLCRILLAVEQMLDTGMCHGMTRDQIQREMPVEWARFCNDPFHYRIPGGESYFDLVQRMSSFVIELERETRCVLVVSHLSTLQVLYGYLVGRPPHQSHNIQMPRHTLIELTPTNYGWRERRHYFDSHHQDPAEHAPADIEVAADRAVEDFMAQIDADDANEQQ